MDTAGLSKLLQEIYATAVDAAARPRLAHKLAAAFDANSCLIQQREDRSGTVSIVTATENCYAFIPPYLEYYHALDEWHRRGRHLHLNQAVLGEELLPENEMVRSEWYADLSRPCEIHHLVGISFELEQGVVGTVGVHRARGAAPFEIADRTLLHLLAAHLKQTLRLIGIAEARDRARDLSFAALTRLSTAIFVLNAEGRLRMMNTAAEEVARRGSDLSIRGGRLSLSQPQLDDRFRAAVRAAAFAPLGRSTFAGETIALERAKGGTLALTVIPLPADAALSGPLEPLAAVFVGVASERFAAPGGVLKALYGLTPAETKLLLALVNGESPNEYASAHGVTDNTVRTQIKSLFVKMDCHRQTDLVRKVLSDPVLRLARG